LLELFAAEVLAEVLDGLREPVKRAGNVVCVRQYNIAPHGVRTSGQAQRILEARSCQCERKLGIVGLVFYHTAQRNRGELRQMRHDAYRPVVRFGVAPNRICPELAEEIRKIAHAFVRSIF
jgi:hypothetical protein